MTVRIEALELRQLEIPMTEPMAAAYGTVNHRVTTIVHLITDVGSGWGECVALNEPTYAPDWADGEYVLLKEVFAQVLLSAPDVSIENVQQILGVFKQHHPAKAAIELAVMDAQLRASGISIAEYLGSAAGSVECAFVIGLLEGDALLRSVQWALDEGYRTIKLKIKPGSDVERIDLIKQEFPGLVLRVDANASYTWDDPEHRKALEQLSDRELALIEQPFHPDRWLPYRQFRDTISIPVALDETLTSSARALNVLEMDICDFLVIKPGLLGGYVLSRSLQQEAVRRGAATMIGGMIETGIARAANIALAASAENADLPAEISPDGRWFNDRLNVNPVKMIDGRIAVSKEPGVVSELDWSVMDKLTRRFHVARC